MVNKLGKRDTYEDDYKPRIIKHKLSSSNETRNKTQFSNWPATKPTHTHTLDTRRVEEKYRGRCINSGTIKQIHSSHIGHDACLRHPRENREPVSRREPPLSAEIRSRFMATRVLRQVIQVEIESIQVCNVYSRIPLSQSSIAIILLLAPPSLPAFDWKFIHWNESNIGYSPRIIQSSILLIKMPAIIRI